MRSGYISLNSVVGERTEMFLILSPISLFSAVQFAFGWSKKHEKRLV